MLYNRITKSDQFFKGWYTTEVDLITRHPVANPGDYAIVADTNTIWIWDNVLKEWVDSGESPVQSYIPRQGIALSGIQDSNNKVYTFPEDYVPGTTRIHVNGVSAFRLYDYNETGTNEITFISFTPTPLDKLYGDYSILP